jgi:hypothetical protein
MNDVTKLKAAAVPYSSIVGSGVGFTDEAGAVVIQIAVMVPSPRFSYEAHAQPFVERLVKLWNEARHD